MNRVDGPRLHLLFQESGLQPYLDHLAASTIEAKREALMAFRPALWGLQVFITGETFLLLDEKGFVCSTKNKPLALALINFECMQGPCALRTVLSRPHLDPFSGVQVQASKYRPHASVPAVRPTPEQRPLRRRKLSAEEFAKLLGDI